MLFKNKKLLRAFLFVFLSALTALIAIVYNREIRFSKQPNDEVLEKVNAHIKNFENQADFEFEKLKSKIKSNESINFSGLNEIFETSVILYKNGKISFWSQGAWVFPFSEVSKTNKIRVLNTNTSKILICRNKFVYNKVEYILVHQIWLSKKYTINNAFLKSGLNSKFFPAKVSNISSQSFKNPIYFQKEFLFSIDFEEKLQQISLLQLSIFSGLIFLFLILFILGISFLIQFLFGIKQNVWAWLILFLCNLGTLSIIYFFKVELSHFYIFQWVDFELLQHLIVSICMLTLIYMPFQFFLASGMRKSKLNFSEFYFWIVDIVCLILIGIALYFLHKIAQYWFEHPYYSFNIFNLGVNTLEKLVTIIIILIIVFSYFMFSHVLSLYFVRRRLKMGKALLGLWIGESIILIVLFELIIPNSLLISFLSYVYLFVSVSQMWPTTLVRPRYITYLYLFFYIIIVSVVISSACYFGEKILITERAKKWANKIHKEAGVIDLYKVKTLSDSLKKDSILNKGLLAQATDFQIKEQDIIKKYLSNQFDEYETNVYLFDIYGNCLNKSIKNYFTYYSNYNKSKFRTSFKGIFKVTGTNTNYYSFIPIYSKAEHLGFVIVEFKFRRLIPNSILPALIRDKVSTNDYHIFKPDFAIFKNENLLTQSGNLSFSHQSDNTFNINSNDLNQGKLDLKKFVQKFDFEDGKSILISYNLSIIKLLISNFSFLFSIFSGVLAIFIFSNTFYFKLKQVSTTFTTKIQLFINIAFFLPLLAVSITSFTIMNSVFTSDLEKSYNEKVSFVSQNLSNIFYRFNQNRVSFEEMSAELERASKYVQADIILYDVDGKMILNTQPSLFEFSVLNSYLNPIAFADITENKEPTSLMDEKVEKFQFKTVYSPIKSYDSGVILGFVSIPFFESDLVFKEKVMDSITAILNVFTLIFILFLIITYLFSQQLTLPLVLLTHKIKNTSLEKNNEPLIYTASDEIGILVKEYNRMLRKLEENKKVLAYSEKESAWREMAKQVAHEIKNPLTPMKLSLQNMQRLLKTDRTDKEEIALRSSEMLLEQIDNLNEIAGSFSTFAQMPLPHKEEFDLIKLVENVVFLFQSEKNIVVSFNTELNECVVYSDEKLMNRILINLIRNAIESVPKDRNPEVKIKILSLSGYAQILVKDNGSGIDGTLGDKIFQPNFSTKTSGSGIGLALAKRGLEQVGGKISFTSEVGAGTEFSIKLPL